MSSICNSYNTGSTGTFECIEGRSAGTTRCKGEVLALDSPLPIAHANPQFNLDCSFEGTVTNSAIYESYAEPK